VRPQTADWKEHNAAEQLRTEHFSIAFDPGNGALTELKHKERRWASPQHPMALLSYQTLSKTDYDAFLASYITVQTDWAPKDFGKPNIEKFGAESKIWNPKLAGCWTRESAAADRLVARLAFGTENPATTAWPQDVYLQIVLPKAQPEMHLELSWFTKRANRLPEALWFSFNPPVFEAQNWTISKVGQPVSPFDVVSGGNRQMHAVSRGITYRDGRGSLELETIDAAVVSLGVMSPIHFSKAQPDLSNGIHFNLFNNGWGTNYVQWFGEDMRFRFVLRAA
jgi:hypothetical protein